MLKKLKNHGFASIVEVIVTSVIFILSIFGVLTAVSMLRPISNESMDNLQDFYAIEGVYKDFHTKVLGDQWLNTLHALYPQIVTNQVVWSIEGWNIPASRATWINYFYNYQITDVPGYPAGEGPRKITINMIGQRF